MQTSRSGFTLIEIAISLMLVAIAVLTVFLVIPSGIRTQTNVRYKIIASTKALEVIELLRGSHPSMVSNARDLDKEGIFPWDTRMAYKSMAPDMEAHLENLRGTVRPLPNTIAYRLDSDNDEIRNLLDAGGRLYYFFPAEPVGALDEAADFIADSDWLKHSRKMLVGVVGNPQQNSILYPASTKVGPYHDFYPSPPTHGRQENSDNWATQTRSNDAGQDRGSYIAHMINYDALCRDPDIAQVLLSDDSYPIPATEGAAIEARASGAVSKSGGTYYARYGFWPFQQYVFRNDTAFMPFPNRPDDDRFLAAKRLAEGYLIAALRYAEKAGLSRHLLFTLDKTDKAEAMADYHSGPDDWKKVLAMRYVAHASTILTSYFPTGLLFDGEFLGGFPTTHQAIDGTVFWDKEGYGVDADDFSDPYAGEGLRIKLGHFTAWHEAAVRMAVLHADKAGPYHWGASRPLNRQVMMDHPLVQLDCWSSPITGVFEFRSTKTGTNAFPEGYTDPGTYNYAPWVVDNKVTRKQWRACYPQPVRAPGLPKMFPGRGRNTNGDGVIDQRDSRSSYNGKATYPARILDTNGDGLLDENDRPVPTASLASSVEPVMNAVAVDGTASWDNDSLRVDLDLNGQPALGPASHCTLTAPFRPQERCRQLVFWAVDWQAYEDFETEPSAAIDASRYPLVAPHNVKEDNQTAWSAGFVQRTDYQRQLNAHNAAALIIPSGRNPELISCFRMPSLVDENLEGDFADGVPCPQLVPTVGEINTFGGWDESDYFRGTANLANGGGPQAPDMRDNHPAGYTTGDPAKGVKGQYASSYNVSSGETSAANAWLGHDTLGAAAPGVPAWNMMIFLGRYGANRNGELKDPALTDAAVTGDPTHRLYTGRGKPGAEVDHGDVPSSVRMRAITVARFNFYDPRVSGSVRY